MYNHHNNSTIIHMSPMIVARHNHYLQ